MPWPASVPQAAVSRAALDRLSSNKPAFFACTPDLAAAVSAPEFGGRGAAALRGTAGCVAADDDWKRCSDLLEKALKCRVEDVVETVRRAVHAAHAVQPALWLDAQCSACSATHLHCLPGARRPCPIPAGSWFVAVNASHPASVPCCVAQMRSRKYSGRASPVLAALGRLLPLLDPDLDVVSVVCGA